MSFWQCCCAAYELTVIGCNSLAVASGHSVVLSVSGVTVETRTTDASGKVRLTSAAGTYDISITDGSGRFATYTSTITLPGGAGSGSVTLTKATGYHCLPGCAYPVSDTLHLSDEYGSTTLTNSGNWTGSKALATACGSCPAHTFTMNYQLLSVNGYLRVSWSTHSGCPDHTGIDGSAQHDLAPTTTCYIPGTSSFQATYTPPSATGAYCVGTTITVTE